MSVEKSGQLRRHSKQIRLCLFGLDSVRLFASRGLVVGSRICPDSFTHLSSAPKPRCINKLSLIDIIVMVTITMVALMLHSLEIIILFDGISIVISLN